MYCTCMHYMYSHVCRMKVRTTVQPREVGKSAKCWPVGSRANVAWTRTCRSTRTTAAASRGSKALAQSSTRTVRQMLATARGAEASGEKLTWAKGLPCEWPASASAVCNERAERPGQSSELITHKKANCCTQYWVSSVEYGAPRQRSVASWTASSWRSAPRRLWGQCAPRRAPGYVCKRTQRYAF